MAARVDLVVVGAGIIGSCTAYAAARRGLSVLLVEQHQLLHHQGSSHGLSRIIRPTYPEDYYASMMNTAYRLWDEAEAEADEAVITRTGGLDFGRKGRGRVEEVIRSCKALGVPHTVLTPREVKARFHVAIPDDFQAVYNDAAGTVNATKAVAMFQRLARSSGARIVERTRVVGLEETTTLGPLQATLETQNDRAGTTPPEASAAAAAAAAAGAAGAAAGAAATNANNAASTSITTTTVHAARVVIAAGSWAGPLIERLTGHRLLLTPIKTTVAYWQISEAAFEANRFSAAHGFPIFINYGTEEEEEGAIMPDDPGDPPCGNPFRRNIYGFGASEMPGLVKVCLHGGPRIRDMDGYRGGPETEVASKFVGPMVNAFFQGQVQASPGAGHQGGPAMAEACSYTMTDDDDYVLDRVPGWGGRVVVGAGFSGHGFKMAPLVGEILADLAHPIDGGGGGRTGSGRSGRSDAIFKPLPPDVMARFSATRPAVVGNDGAGRAAKL